MAQVVEALVRLVTPILVHTAEEIWTHLPRPATGEREPSVHLARWPQVDPQVLNEDLLAKWEWLQEVRRDAFAVLEVFRRRSLFDKHTEARVALAVADKAELARLKEMGAAALADLLMVSELVLATPEEAEAIPGEKAQGAEAEVKRFSSATLMTQSYGRCERCWAFRPDVGKAEPADLCGRCAAVVAKK
jgi:isoleucyl-tRNA synthetase